MIPNILIKNARIFTADPSNPTGEALVTQHNRIAFVGSNQEASALRDSATRVIDAHGCTLMPGLIDSHFHLLSGSIELREAQLREVRTINQLANVLHEYGHDHPNQEWILGQGLMYLSPPEGGALTRHHLDAINPDRPIAVTTYDGHTLFTNTLALEKAGILHGGKAGPGSEIVIGDDGLATGELREPGAFHHVEDLIPGPTESEKQSLLHRGLCLAVENGITSVHNMDGEMGQLARYLALEEKGELPVRVYVPYTIRPDTPIGALEEAAQMKNANPKGFARGGAVKFFMDGVIESFTALMLDDYAVAPGTKGSALYTADQFIQLAIAADRLGMQIFTHAIGDGAVRRALDGYEAVQRVNGKRDSRHRVEHIEVIHPDDLPRFDRLGVIASMQPYHAPKTAFGHDLWPSRVGVERWDFSFAWNLVRNSQAHLVFGSDWPVVSLNPLTGVYSALNRNPWQENLAEHRQTLRQTLLSYTIDGAYAEFREHEKGMLKSGYLADIVLLSEDIFAVPPDEIARIYPVLTVMDGRVVFEKQ